MKRWQYYTTNQGWINSSMTGKLFDRIELSFLFTQICEIGPGLYHTGTIPCLYRVVDI